ncbi:hypothetical protein [Salinimicrobium sp. GXAS 041]
MSNKEKEYSEREENSIDKVDVRTNQLLIFAFFIFLVLLGYLVRS